MVLGSSCDSEHCILLYYGRILINLLNGANFKILNDTHAFLMTNILTCLLALGGGSAVHYVLATEYDASMVNTFRIGPFTLNALFLPKKNTNSH